MLANSGEMSGETDIFCGAVQGAAERATAPIIPGVCVGWQETSLAFAESICDVSGRVADLFEATCTYFCR